MSGESSTDAPRVFGVLCTYGRPDLALEYLDILSTQTKPPEVVYVVDNSSDSSLRTSIADRPRTGVPAVYVDAGTNAGPAGAFGIGFRMIEDTADPRDIVVFFDDDDPPVAADQLQHLFDSLIQARAEDAQVIGIGLSGGTLATCTGMVRSVPDTGRLVDVDHLHGGYLPHYTVAALSSVGGNDETFFYGFEELELGRRLHLRGFRLLVDAKAARDVAGLYPKKLSTGGTRLSPDEGTWSRFHKERNLIRVLKRERLWSAIAFTVAARHVAKPCWITIRNPRVGWPRLVLGLRATLSGVRGETGIDPRYPPPTA